MRSRLSGPTVDADLAAFRSAFAGAPAKGALAALRRFDHGSVYGDALYRVAIPGFAEANRMEADLDMAGNAIEGAGTIEAASLEVETDLSAGGDLAVTGDLVVGRAVRASGTVEAGETMTASAARISGPASAGSMTVSGAVRAQTVEAARPGRGRVHRRRRRGGRGQRPAGRAGCPVGDRPDDDGGFGLGCLRHGHTGAGGYAAGCGRRRHLASGRRALPGVPVMRTPVRKPIKGKAAVAMATALAAMALAMPVPAWGGEEEAWDAERAFVELERLQAEIGVLRALAGAQAALLAWNRDAERERQRPGGACAASLRRGRARALVSGIAGHLRRGRGNGGGRTANGKDGGR